MKSFKEFITEADGYDLSSVQANFEDEVKNKILAFGKSIPNEEIVFEENKGREDEPHVTILYGINGIDSEPIKELLSGTGAFEVTFKEVSIFEMKDKDYDVLKVELDSPHLFKLHHLITTNIDYTKTQPVYIPHVTICYLKKEFTKKYVGNEVFKDLKTIIHEVIFSPSKGEKVTIDLK